MKELNYDEMKMLYNFMAEMPSAKVLDEVQRMRGLSAQEFMNEMNVLKNRINDFKSICLSVDDKKENDQWYTLPKSYYTASDKIRC